MSFQQQTQTIKDISAFSALSQATRKMYLFFPLQIVFTKMNTKTVDPSRFIPAHSPPSDFLSQPVDCLPNLAKTELIVDLYHSRRVAQVSAFMYKSFHCPVITMKLLPPFSLFLFPILFEVFPNGRICQRRFAFVGLLSCQKTGNRKRGRTNAPLLLWTIACSLGSTSQHSHFHQCSTAILWRSDGLYRFSGA